MNLSEITWDPLTGTNLTYSKLKINQLDESLQLDNVFKFKFIQHLSITNCQLLELHQLNLLEFLTHLDLSGNRFREIPNCPLLKRLVYLDMSSNQIMSVENLSHFSSSLKYLVLDKNLITLLDVLKPFPFLIHFSLANNGLRSIANLLAPNLEFLNLSNNRISSLNGLENLGCLRKLNMANNHLPDIKDFPSLPHLHTVNLSQNNLEDMDSLKCLGNLINLCSLFLTGNPLCQKHLPITFQPRFEDETMTNDQDERYRFSVIALFPKLLELDGIAIRPMDKIKAEHLIFPSPIYIERQQAFEKKLKAVSKCLRYTPLESQMYSVFTPLVLVGPAGTGKRTIKKRIIEKYPQFQFCPSHTTRKPKPGERDAIDYFFVSPEEIKSYISSGEAVQSAEFYGQTYALLFQTLWKCVVEGKFPIVDLEIEGLIEMKEIEGLKLNVVYIAPPSQQTLLRRIDQRSEKQKQNFLEQMERSKSEKIKLKREHNNHILKQYNERRLYNLQNVLPPIKHSAVTIQSLEREIEQQLGQSVTQELKVEGNHDEAIRWNLSETRQNLYNSHAEIPGFFDAVFVNDDLEKTVEKLSQFIKEKY